MMSLVSFLFLELFGQRLDKEMRKRKFREQIGTQDDDFVEFLPSLRFSQNLRFTKKWIQRGHNFSGFCRKMATEERS